MPRPRPSSRVLQSPVGPVVRVDEREFVYFGGTGYLGLQSHPDVVEAGCKAMRELGLHAATSRAMYGTSEPVLAVERNLAAMFGVSAAYYTVSGYAGPAILVTMVAPDIDRVFLDSHAHYCIEDAARGAGLPVHRFAHCDAESLATKLRTQLEAGERPAVITDGMFALSGRVPPLEEYVAVLDEYDLSALIVDDAHGVGTYGPNGRGTLDLLGLWGRVTNLSGQTRAAGESTRVLFCGTTSKALGGYGGFVVGDGEFVARAREASHWFDGASPLPAPVAAATARAIEIAAHEPQRRHRLRSNVGRVRAGLVALGLDDRDCSVFGLLDSPSPVLAIRRTDPDAVGRLHESLMEDGFIVPFVRSYSGTDGGGGPNGAQDASGPVLRLAVFATHTEDHIDSLLAAMARHLG